MPAVPKKWIRNPSDHQAIDEGCYFDPAAAARPVEFIEAFCRQSIGRWARKPLLLLDWQKDFLFRLFGWKRSDGLRRFRKAYLEIAKKNGKSTLLSGLVLYMAMADEEEAAEVHLNACDKNQASLIFKEAARMVRSSPELAARLEVLDGAMRIVDPIGNNSIITNSSEVAGKDGPNASAVIFDELHRQKDRKLWDVFEYAGIARLQPLHISLTTAGEDDQGIWHEQRKYGEDVNKGLIPDTTFLGVVYRAGREDDIEKPSTWKKANPSLGQIISPADFAADLKAAKTSAEKLANFKRLRLNIITSSTVDFIDLAHWDACDQKQGFATGDSFFGLDLSSVNDLTAMAEVVKGDGFIDLYLDFWLPEDNIDELSAKHGVNYRLWADYGLITLTQGSAIDYKWIRKEINERAEERFPKKILIDPYNSTQIAIDLGQEDGLPVATIRQGFLSLSPPTKELKRLVLAGELRHGGNPVLRWMAGNAKADQDSQENIKINKKKSGKKVDGLAATVNAIAAMTDQQAVMERSPYEDHGLIVLDAFEVEA